MTEAGLEPTKSEARVQPFNPHALNCLSQLTGKKSEWILHTHTIRSVVCAHAQCMNSKRMEGQTAAFSQWYPSVVQSPVI